MMKKQMVRILTVALVSISLLGLPATGRAQESSDGVNGLHIMGSVLFSILHLPMKLVTCVGTQVGAAVPYTATFGVPGHYDGGTNGRDIGETARKSCMGDWVIKPSHVKADYGS